jgi:cellulose synthase/poly-beta-1,6-N-acetylglucosamine synthase-like glycosyltransferase
MPLLMTIQDAVVTGIRWADIGIFAYFLLLNSFYALLLGLSIPELWANARLISGGELDRMTGSDALPPISLIVPAYNEEVTIVDSLRSFLTLAYMRFEIVLVNDGSSDGTLDRLIAAYDLYEVPPAFPVAIGTKPIRAYYRSRHHSKLLVIDKENGGKADSLNAGINAARFPYFLAVDADTLIEPDALVRLARPFLLGESVAAVGGTIRVANACRIEHGRVIEARVDRRWLPGCQVVEYLRAFLFGRLGWNRLGGNPIISGAFGLFRRDYVLSIGGYKTGNVTEDMDLVVRLHRFLHEHKIRAVVPFVPDPVAWTEVPATRQVLSLQRERWHRGLIATLLAHRTAMFNPKYGRFGLVAYPFFFFGEMLSPVVEALGYILTIFGLAFGVINLAFASMFALVTLGYGMLLSLLAVTLEEMNYQRYHRWSDFGRLIWFILIEPFGYRQLTVWYRLQAFWRFARREHTWGAMRREGFAVGSPAAAEP